MKKIIFTVLFMGILSGGYAQDSSSPYQAKEALDHSGDYTRIQEAVNAAPATNEPIPTFSRLARSHFRCTRI